MLLALAACSGNGETETGNTIGETTVDASSTTAATPTTDGTAPTTDDTTAADTTSITSTDGTTSTSDATGMTTATSATASDTTPVDPRLCALEELDPNADVEAAVDEGDGPGQIPTVIGEALVRNCGCHYTDDLPPGFVDYMSNTVQLRTWADFQAEFVGTIPEEYVGMPTYLAVQERVVAMQPLPMPAVMCQVEGEPGLITMADLALFTDWLAAGAPDGASFP